MTLRVHLQAEDGAAEDLQGVERAARAALDACQIRDGELTVVLTDDAALRQLNQDHRGLDQPTDVLSFPMDEADPDSGLPYLGDVVISTERAQVQAEEEGHSLSAELALLTVHGVLHLVGYDHQDPERQQEMWDLQSKVLAALGNQILGPSTP